MHRSRLVPALAAFVVATVAPLGEAGADEPQVFTPTPSMDLAALGVVIARRSQQVQSDLLAVDAAVTDAKQARVLGNPQVDASWATIPVGPTNPEGLSSPLTQVPSYGLGVSYTFPIGKRGPRQRRADAVEEAARASVAATTRGQAIGLARLLGAMAVAALRVDGLRELVEEQKGSISLAETRVRAGFGTPLDVDRLLIEKSRTEQQVLSNEADLRQAQSVCAGVLGQRCAAFSSTDDARTFLTTWARRAEAVTPQPALRPDVRALDATRRAYAAEADLARATAIPDPTIRVGYLFDQFVVSGNQRHSINVSVAIPVPLFDGGGVQRDGAVAKEARLSAQRARLLEGATARVGALREVLASQKRRRDLLMTDMLPRARTVVSDLEKAAGARLIPLTDVIQARRTLSELLIQEAETEGDAFQTSMDLLSETPSDGEEGTR